MTNKVKLSVSNIAWDNHMDPHVANYLIKSDISYVEIALTRYYSDLFSINKDEMLELKKRWQGFGVSISSLQSLLFNQPELCLFGDSKSKSRMKDLLIHLSKQAHFLEAKALVFGAPKNRLKGDLDINSAILEAGRFFAELDSHWFSQDNFLALEANPIEYGCDFLTKSSEAFEFVDDLGLKNLRWHLDTACTELGGESVLTLLSGGHSLPAHIHLSETNLAPLVPTKMEFYIDFFDILKKRQYAGFVVLEMRDTGDIDDLFGAVELMREALNK